MPHEGVSLAGHEDILRYEEILHIVRAAIKVGISKVRITGGEPLVRRGIIDFVGDLCSLAGLQDVSLTTNGTLLADYATALAQKGLTRINISLDSFKAERYSHITGGGNLQAVLAGISAAQREGFYPLKINTVAIKGFNDDEVLDFAKFAFDNDLQVRFIELMPIGGNSLGGFISNDEIKRRIAMSYHLRAMANEEQKEANAGPAQIFALSGGKGKIGFISPLSHNFCERCNRLRLTAVGSLRACLLSDEEVNIRSALREGCSSEELESLIRGAIAHKPLAHSLNPKEAKQRKCQRDMFQIGG